MKKIETKESVILQPKSITNFCIIWMHGLGANGFDFYNLIPELDFDKKTQTRFIFPHAENQKVTINNGIIMPSWYDITGISDMNREINLSTLTPSISRIKKLIDEQIRLGIKSENIILAGFSQGGVVASYSCLSYEKKLGGLMILSSYLPMWNEYFKKTSLNQPLDLPIFLAHGTRDNIVNYHLSDNSNEYLSGYYKNISRNDYPMAHELCYKEILDISKWLNNICN